MCSCNSAPVLRWIFRGEIIMLIAKLLQNTRVGKGE